MKKPLHAFKSEEIYFFKVELLYFKEKKKINRRKEKKGESGDKEENSATTSLQIQSQVTKIVKRNKGTNIIDTLYI